MSHKKGDKSKYFLQGPCSWDLLVGMPRIARQAPGGMIFHVTNRGNARDRIFDDDADYAAFEKTVFEKDLAETQAQVFVPIFSDCLVPNHWHVALWPLQKGDLGRFLQRFTTIDARR